MSLTSLENEIVWALRIQLKNRSITKSWLQEWATHKETVEKNMRPGEELIEINKPWLRCWVALKKPERKPKPANP